MAISPDWKRLATGTSDNTIALWALPNVSLLGTMDEHRDPIGDLAISPDGNLLFSASKGHTIKMQSLPDGKLIKTLEGHTDAVLILSRGTLARVDADGITPYLAVVL